MKVYDILQFAAKIRGITGHKFDNALDKVIHQCGLEGIIHKLVGACSKGYKQRVGLAMAIIHDPSILIFDEPTSSLDLKNESKIMNDLYNLSSNITIIIISHRLSIFEKCKKILEVKNGKVFQIENFSNLNKNFVK